ncbi:glycosyltransferase [Crenobacter luteus]|uniref:glycosyltransferase n=1 Tax=Crenobacter luteus TaxID=1452487 RepID=UPI0018D36DC8|nr:glycosyltransferase [Crenobacter luteus]
MQIDVNYDHSSTGMIVKDLQFGLEAKGHQVLVCFGREVAGLKSAAIRIAPKWEVYAHAALTRLTGWTGNFSPVATRKCIEYIEAFKPDVVHLHELHGYFINYRVLIEYLKRKGMPVVWTFHCEFMYTGKCGYSYDCERWKAECGNCPQVTSYPASLYFDKTHEMLQQKKKMFTDFDRLKIIAPSKWLADRVRQSLLNSKDIGVIYNGIDVENTFTPQPTEALRKELGIKTKHVLVSIAPDLMSERKGGKWILQLAARLVQDDVTLVMVGVDNPEVVSAPNTIVLPRLGDKQELAKYYSLGDFFLLTSKKETFSLVCAESLACGTPIIGFDAGAPTEVAPPGYGLFVEYGNLDQLQAAVLDALHRRIKFRSGPECTDYAFGMFGKKKMVQSYIAEYEELVCRV